MTKKNKVKNIILFICSAIFSLSACAGEPDAEELHTSQSETTPADVEITEEQNPSPINIEIKEVGHPEFSSFAETINVDGKCYGKSSAYVNFEPGGGAEWLTDIDESLTKDALDNAEYIGSGYSAAEIIAFNDFRTENAEEYKGGLAGPMFSVNEKYLVSKRTRKMSELKEYNPSYEAYDDDYEVAEYMLFSYNEEITIIAEIGCALYEDMNEKNTFGISEIYFVENDDEDCHYLEAIIDGNEEKLKGFLSENYGEYDDYIRIKAAPHKI